MQQPSAERIWTAAQQLLRTILNPDIYNLWFAPLQARDLVGEEITLEVANDFCEVWLKDNYLGLIRDVLASAAGQHLKVNFRVAPAKSAPPVNGTEVPADAKAKSSPIKPAGHKSAEHGFNPKNTFDTFVVGSNNTFAHAAALAVSQTPGKVLQPALPLWWCWTWKTHLLQRLASMSSRTSGGPGHLRFEREIHERIHRRDPKQPVGPFSSALSSDRRVPHR
jgi:chromosomal replication initiator protein